MASEKWNLQCINIIKPTSTHCQIIIMFESWNKETDIFICLLNKIIPVGMGDMLKNNNYVLGKLKNMKHFSKVLWSLYFRSERFKHYVGLFRPCFFFCVESSFELWWINHVPTDISCSNQQTATEQRCQFKDNKNSSPVIRLADCRQGNSSKGCSNWIHKKN